MRNVFVAAVLLVFAGCEGQQGQSTTSSTEDVSVERESQALTGDNAGGKNLAGANLGGANLGGANLGGANLGGANLGGANLGGANLGGANLGGANLGGANLGGANLGGANLGGANQGGMNLGGANLGGANLAGANLGGANLAGPLMGTNMMGIEVGMWTDPNGIVTGVNPQSTSLFASGAPRADLTAADTGINIHRLASMPTTASVPGPNVNQPLFDVSQGASGYSVEASVRVSVSNTAMQFYSFLEANGSSSRTASAPVTVTLTPAYSLPGQYINSITVRSVKASNRGKMNITLDGVLKGTVDLYSATPTLASVLTISNVSPGAHTLVLAPANQKHASSTGFLIDVDALQFTAPGAATAGWTGTQIYREGPPALSTIEAVQGSYSRPGPTPIQYRIQGDSQTASALASGGSYMGGFYITYADDNVKALTIYSVKGPNRGKAQIQVDYMPTVTVDLYAPYEIREAIFSTSFPTQDGMPTPPGVAPGGHVVEISRGPGRNARSTGYDINVDTFEATVPGAPQLLPDFSASPAVLFSGEDLFHASFLGTSNLDTSCIVMGLGSTAFSKLVYDNSGQMKAAIGKLPWQITSPEFPGTSLDAWEVVAYGSSRYCVFVVAAPADSTYDGVAGYLKAVYRWNAPSTASIQIGAIGGGQAIKQYTGMMDAANRLYRDGSLDAETLVGGELAFVNATTNNVSVNVDFSSWFRDSRNGARRLMGSVSNAPQYLEGAYVAYKTSSGNIGVMLVPGSKAARGTVSAPTLVNGRYNYYLKLPNGTQTTIHDSGAEVARAYTDWLNGPTGQCVLTGLCAGSTSTPPPLPKRCAGVRAIAQSAAYATIMSQALMRCRPMTNGAYPAWCTADDIAARAVMLQTGVDPVLANVMNGKCDASILTDNSDSTFAFTAKNSAGATVEAVGHSAVTVRIAGGAPAATAGDSATFTPSPTTYQTYADSPPDTLDVAVTYDGTYYDATYGYPLQNGTETVTVLGGTYVHLNDAPF